jgi:hypothetical protein
VPEHPLRVGIDGPPWSGLSLAGPLREALERRSRAVLAVDTGDFLRPASVRLELGRDDAEMFRHGWVDYGALRREVLDPLGPGGSRRWLPTLWDPDRDRATREDYREAPAQAVLLCSGAFLLGRGLPFDRVVHVALGPGARRRRVPADDAARELPAWDAYVAEVDPAAVADVVVRADDPRHPAVVVRDSRQPGSG